MATNGQVNITITDTGAVVSLPAADVQVHMGCCSSGDSNTVLATRQPTTLRSTYGYGPLVEAAALALGAGATVLAIRLPTVTAGAVAAKATKSVSGATNATPIVVTTSASHGLVDGDVVTISGVGGNTNANTTAIVNVTAATTFEMIGIAGNGAYTSGGTVTPKGAIMLASDGTNVASGTAPVYFSGAAYDDFFIEVIITTGGTVGSAGIFFTVSLDAGRTTNLPRIALGTSTTYVIPGTNVTINFGTGTLTAGYTIRGYTTAPQPDASGITAAIDALAGGPYGNSGWGSMLLAHYLSATDAGTVGTRMDSLFTTDQIDARLMFSVRDASPPAAYGGTGESDSTWSTAVLADYVNAEETRMVASAGYYNMRSAFATTVCGLPLYRRPLSWAHACRVLALPSRADHEGWVRLGGIPQITKNDTTDPTDGFVYHNEAAGFVFDSIGGGAGRMTAAKTYRRKPGYYFSNPLTLALLGSSYQLFPYCRVIDDAATLIRQVLTNDLFARIKVNPNGTITEKQAKQIEADCYRALDSQMGGNFSGRTIVVNREQDIKSTGILKLDATINGDAFALEIDVNLGLA